MLNGLKTQCIIIKNNLNPFVYCVKDNKNMINLLYIYITKDKKNKKNNIWPINLNEQMKT